MNNKERKKLTLTMFPYVLILTGIIAILVIVYEYCPFTERAATMILPTLIIVLAFFIVFAIAFLAGDVFNLKLYLKKQLEYEGY